jgi:hypothetical protein
LVVLRRDIFCSIQLQLPAKLRRKPNFVLERAEVVERLVRVVQQRPVPIVLKPHLLQLHQLPSWAVRHIYADELHQLRERADDLILWLNFVQRLLLDGTQPADFVPIH